MAKNKQEHRDSSSVNVTQLLQKMHHGDESAYNKLFPAIYDELRQVAHRIRFKYYGNNTLNTTAIVHEAYLKLIDSDSSFENRTHFFCVAGKAMRQILINHARHKQAAKRGGHQEKHPIEEWQDKIYLSDDACKELLSLEEALKKLESKDQRQGRIVECRFFAGMSIEETATTLNISPATVKRSWQTAKAWLYGQINDPNKN